MDCKLLYVRSRVKRLVNATLVSVFLSTIASAELPNVQISAPSMLQQNEEQIFFCPTDSSIVVANWREVTWDVNRLGGIGRSTDGGMTWSAHLNSLTMSPNSANSDPTIAVASDGTLYMSFLDFIQEYFLTDSSFLVFIKSTDKGETWNGPYPVDSACGAFFEDKQMITVDRTISPYHGNVYVAWSRYSTPGPPYIPVAMFARSTDGALTFDEPIVIGPPRPNPGCEHPKSGGHFTQPMVGPGGVVYVFFSSHYYDGCEQHIVFSELFMTKSTDGGETWPDTPVTIFEFDTVSTVDGGVNVYSAPSGSVDISAGPYSGNIYVSTINGQWDNGYYHADVIVLKSTDGGESWLPAVRVNDDPLGADVDQFHPWLVTNEDGVVAVIFYDQRTDPTHFKFDAFAAYSFDGGETFTTNHRLSNVSIDPNKLYKRGGRAGKIAEYIGITAYGDYINAAWTDTRFGQQDVLGTYYTIPLLRPRLFGIDNGAYSGSETDSLCWSTCWHENDISYRIEIDDDSLFGSVTVLETLDDNKLHLGLVSLTDGLYHWRVKAFRISQGDSTDYSDVWSFERDTEPPLVAVLISPSEGDTIYDNLPGFTWSVGVRLSGSPEFYELELSSDSLFSGKEEYRHYDGISDTVFELPEPLTEYGIYFWRVNHYDMAGNESGYSDIAAFNLASYVCGDADKSGNVDIDDIVFLIDFIFAGGPTPQPYQAGDADCSAIVDIDDAVYLIAYIFSGGYEPCEIDGDGVPDC